MTKKLTYAPLGNPLRDYRQDKFIISTFKVAGKSNDDISYEATERIIKNLKEAHLNQIELGWTHPDTIPKAIKVCNEEGLDLIVQNLDLFGGFQCKPRLKTTEEDVINVIKLYGDEPCVKGYYIWDEPWEDEDIASAAEQTDWFFKHAPGKLNLAIYNPWYNPKYNWKNNLYPYYVKKFLDEVKPPVVCFDHYPYGAPPVNANTEEQLDNSLLWKDLGVAREESLKRNTPFWFYWSAIRTHKNYPQLLEKGQIRLQIFYALMYGAKALQVYGATGCGCGPDGYDEPRKMLSFEGEKEYFYDTIKEALGEAEQLGKTFMALTSEHIYHSDEVLKEDEYFNTHFREDIGASDIFDMTHLPKRCSVGTFRDDYGNKYIYILNRDYNVGNTFSIKLKEKMRIYEVSGVDGLQHLINEGTDTIGLCINASSGILLRLDNIENPIEDIIYVCD